MHSLQINIIQQHFLYDSFDVFWGLQELKKICHRVYMGVVYPFHVSFYGNTDLKRLWNISHMFDTYAAFHLYVFFYVCSG